MTQEDKNSLFTSDERDYHINVECELIQKAKQGNLNPIFTFWHEKKKLFMRRAFERSPYNVA